MSGREDASDALLRRVSEARTPLAGTRAQRGVVAAACNYCRVKKVKCDAQRPCSTCVKRNLDCHYETTGSEIHSQASKRKHDELSRSHDTHAQLFHLLATCTGTTAADICQRIRAGHRPGDIVAHFTQPHDGRAPTTPVHRTVRQLFLTTLAHGTGSLLDMVRLAMWALDPTLNIQLPDFPDLLLFRNRVAHIHRVEALLLTSSGLTTPLSALSTSPVAQRADSGFVTDSSDCISRENRAVHQVPASPWLAITDNDEAVTHLVSLFLAWINPSWRFVEQDLFLQGMRSRVLESPFCSPLLVNSICSIACLHSEHDIAFVGGDRDRITRGQHFRNQALRLWSLEQSGTTLTKIQALCILSLDSNYRAMDKQGLSLIPIAVQLDNELPFHPSSAWCVRRGVSEQDYVRARLAAHWCTICTHIIMRLAFMKDMTVRPIESDVPKIHKVFQDDVDLWIAYPLSIDAVPHRSTLYLRERCTLAGIFKDIHTLIFADKHKKPNVREFLDGVDRLSSRMNNWFERLPFELQYEWPMCVAIWELHASYLSTGMTLRLVARNRCLLEAEKVEQQPSSPDEADAADAMQRTVHDGLTRALALAYKAAQMLRDFRERYGLKITPAWLLQLQAVAASVLVLDEDLKVHAISTPDEHVAASRSPIADSHTAFDEVFRCLLGTAVEVMIARAIARMIYHTALEQKIILSRSSRTMLQIMADTAWRPSDLSLLNSAFPDFTTISGDEESSNARSRLGELLTRWEKMDV